MMIAESEGSVEFLADGNIIDILVEKTVKVFVGRF
jgi:hypothetical protein